jgi:hypothetical protein
MQDAAASKVTVKVLYQKRPCANAADSLVAPAPVTAGTLVLQRAGHTAKISLLEGGEAQVALGGKGDIKATLVLETPRIRVVEGAGGSGAQRISLGHRAVRKGDVTFSVGSSLEDNGHVNTLILLQRAARVAAVTAPRQLPLAIARVYDGDVAARPWTAFEAPNTIHVGRGPRGFEGAADTDAQWEPAPLMHEYGHFLLGTIAPDGSQGGDHNSSTSYPDRPNLAWSEGFPSAFAATVLSEWSGRFYVDCGRPIANYAEVPARPQLATDRDRRYAQYNETRVAGATYNLIGYLGGGEAGLKKLLSALPDYHRDGHSVWTARDLRDLAAQQFEQSAADHAAIDKIFLGEGMSWWQSFNVGVYRDSNPYGTSADAELVISVTGPGGFDCRNTTGNDIDAAPGSPVDDGLELPGKKAADGGLSYSANDDCYLVSGDGRVADPNEDPHGFGSDGAQIQFPYLSGLAHWNGPFQVHAKYVCDFDQRAGPREEFNCPSSVAFPVYAGSPYLLGIAPELATPTSVSLPRGVDTVVATFTADGKCEILGSGATTDCGF